MVKEGALNTNGGLAERAVRNMSGPNLVTSSLVHTYFSAFAFARAASGTGDVFSFSSLPSLPIHSLLETSSSSSTTHSECCSGIWRVLINFAMSLASFAS